MTREEVFKVLVLIETVYPHCVHRDETVLQWFLYAEKIDFDEVYRKLLSHIRKSPYPPGFRDLAAFKDDSDMLRVPTCWVEKTAPTYINNWQLDYTLKD
jgi:hypothetical protein